MAYDQAGNFYVKCPVATEAELQEAIKLVERAGYKVSKPRAPKPAPHTLNAIGKPYGAGFDPSYRMNYRTNLANLRKPFVRVKQSYLPGGEAGKRRWMDLCIDGELDAVRAGRMQPSECRFACEAVAAKEHVPAGSCRCNQFLINI